MANGVLNSDGKCKKRYANIHESGHSFFLKHCTVYINMYNVRVYFEGNVKCADATLISGKFC